MEPQLPSLCHQTSPLPSSAKVQPPKPARRNLSKAEISANLQLHDVKASAWSSACTEQKVKTTKESLVNIALLSSGSLYVAVRLKSTEYFCATLSCLKSKLLNYDPVECMELLICYSLRPTCVFFQKQLLQYYAFPPMQTVFWKCGWENGAEWKIVQSQWHRSAYTPSPPSPSRTLKPNSIQIFHSAQLMSGQPGQTNMK